MQHFPILLYRKGDSEILNFKESMQFFHDPYLFKQNLECAFKEDVASGKEHEIMNRLFGFWEAMKHSAQDLGIEDRDDIWKTLKNRYHSKLIAVLENKDIDEAVGYFLNICKTKAVRGFMNHCLYDELINNKQKRDFEAMQTLDILCRLAEALGVLPLECPENGHWGQNINVDIPKTITDLENVIGYEISSPRAGGGTFGLSTQRGILSRKDIVAIYQTHRLAEILNDDLTLPIAEIGGGAGVLMFHLYRKGFRNLRLYDLAQVAVIQGYYLIKSLPNTKISLFGEKEISESDIAVLPYWEFSNSRNNSYRLVLNSDSFPEIERVLVVQYLEDIKRVSDLFLSFNQEGSGPMWEKEHGVQNVVKDLIQGVGGFRRKYRILFWMRRGYVEELYESVTNVPVKEP